MIKNISWMIFDKVFLILLNLVVTVRVANHYGASLFGEYQYAVSIASVLEVLVTFVDGRIVKKSYSRHPPETVVFCATVCRVLFSGLSFLIGLVLIAVLKADRELSVMLVMQMLVMTTDGLLFGMANRFEFLLESKKVVIALDASRLLSGLGQLLAIRLDWGIPSIPFISLLCGMVNLVILRIQYRREFHVPLIQKPDRSLIKGMIRESAPLAVAASCATIYTRCDSVMLGAMLGSAEVGIYSISLKLINVIQIPIGPVRETVFPKFINLYETDRKRYEYCYVKLTSIACWGYLVIAALSVTVLPFFFRFLSPEYAEAFPVFKIHLLGSFFMFNALLRAGHFTLTGDGRILMWAQLVSVAVNIVLNLAGIRRFGMYGAAMATALTQFISLFLSNLFFRNGRQVFWWQVKALNPKYIFMKGWS